MRRHARSRAGILVGHPVAGRDRQRSDESSTWYEEFKVSGDEAVAKVRELIREGNVRRVFIKNEKGATMLEIPLNAGLAVTAVMAMAAPALVAVGAVAALLTRATIGVERQRGPEDEAPGTAVVPPGSE